MKKLWQWIDERTGITGPIKGFLSYPVPGYVHRNPLYSLGGLTLIIFMLMAITGIFMTFYYDPSPEGAYGSVDYITYVLPLGWLVRGIHHYGASALVVLAVLHMLRAYFFAAYKKPREINWMTGVVLLFLILSFGFTGYLLPWDQKGYWATKVGTEIAGSMPIVGDAIMRLMRGGAELGQATLTRFYATHIGLLPTTVVALIALHIYQLRFHGMAPAITEKQKEQSKKSVPFFPNWVLADAVYGIILFAGLAYLSWAIRAPLGFPADPTSSNFIPRPEWYFLFYFQLLKYFPGKLEPVVTILIPGFIFGSMLLLPFFDKSKERHPKRKPVTTIAGIFYILAVIVLTVLAMNSH
jgi:ubiquinol-cytochrome c reductase cytochrome b subunit